MRPSLRLLYCGSFRIGPRADFRRTCASHPQTSRTDPASFPTPTGPGADRACLAFQAAGAWGGAAVTTTQKPRPSSPPPPPARASCHVAQGRRARHCGAGPRGGSYQRPPLRHPRRPAQWFGSFGTRANSKGLFPGSQQPIKCRNRGGGE